MHRGGRCPLSPGAGCGHDDVDAASKLAGETIMTARKVEEAEPRLRINLDEDIDIAFGRGVSIGVQS